MNIGWIETAGVLVIIMLSSLLGAKLARAPRPWWLLSFSLPLIGFLTITATARLPQVASSEEFGWLVAGRTEFVLLAALLPLMVFAPLFRVPRRSARVLGVAYTAMAVGWFCLMPFFTSAALAPEFEALETRIDDDGICHQSRRYLCGPAAAVTTLRLAGVEAHEGELAIAAKSSPVHGTDPISLCHAMSALGDRRWTYRMMSGIDELKASLPAIVLVARGSMVEHYVTVLDINGERIVVGDPMRGRRELPVARFNRIWRGTAIVEVEQSE